jgi:hypothetical protein
MSLHFIFKFDSRCSMELSIRIPVGDVIYYCMVGLGGLPVLYLVILDGQALLWDARTSYAELRAQATVFGELNCRGTARCFVSGRE